MELIKPLPKPQQSYVLLSIKVNGNVEEALDNSNKIINVLNNSGYNNITILNTIQAPKEEANDV